MPLEPNFIQNDFHGELSVRDVKQISRTFQKIAAAIVVLSSILVLCIIQYGYAHERIGGGDIENYIQCFTDRTYFTGFYIREFAYYYLGKLLTQLFGDPYMALSILDYLCLGAILLNFPTLRRNPLYVFVIMISPLFMTGFTNIHRQLIATAAYIVLDNRAGRNRTYRRLALGAFCVFIHNYMAVVVSLEAATQLVMQKKKVQAIAFSVVVALFVYAGSRDYDKFVDASTSELTYTAWCTALLISGAVVDRIESYTLDRFRHVAFIALIVVSNILFAIGSGAGGGRLMLGGATIYFFRTLFPGTEMLRRQRVRGRTLSAGSVNAFLGKVALCVVMVAPVFFNPSTQLVMAVSVRKIQELM